MTGSVLVIGGAGYIGSHIVRHLLAEERRVLVVDDLSTGSPDAVAGSVLYTQDFFSPFALSRIIAEHGVDTVVHVAAPPRDHERSVLSLGGADGAQDLATMFGGIVRSGASKVVFTSSCAVYGLTAAGRTVNERFTTLPLSRYAAGKLAAERHLLSLSRASGLQCVVLRCFNVAGVHHGNGFCGTTGDRSRLINMACEVSVGKRTHVPILGLDFPTTDGSFVRDYVHVDDVATAHVNAVSYLEGGGRSIILNCGSGCGRSVLDVLRTVEDEAVLPIPTRVLPRRSGEIPFMVADIDAIGETLCWAPRSDSLVSIVRDSLAYERAR